MPLRYRTLPLLLSLLLPFNLQGQDPRRQLSLDGAWKFAFSDANADQTGGDMAADFDDAAYQTVLVPHSWPEEGKLLPQGGFRASATYRRTFTTAPEWKNKRVILQFDAVSLSADVRLNGKRIGTHRAVSPRSTSTSPINFASTVPTYSRST